MENSGRFHARRCNLEIVVVNLRQNFMSVMVQLTFQAIFFMGDKQSMLEFAREPAGGGCGREWWFPVQCMVVARICQGVSHGGMQPMLPVRCSPTR